MALKKSDEEALKEAPSKEKVIAAISYPLDRSASNLYSCAIDIYGNVYEYEDCQQVDWLLVEGGAASIRKVGFIFTTSCFSSMMLTVFFV